MSPSQKITISLLSATNAEAARAFAARPDLGGTWERFLAGSEGLAALRHPASVIACDMTGAICGFLLVSPSPLADGSAQALLRPVVAPMWQRRGVGSALLVAATNALRHGPETISIHALFAWQPCPALAALAARHGFTLVRHFHHLERAPHTVPPPQWPVGIELRRFDGREEMFAAWNDAYNGSFASHFRFRPGTVADCRDIASASDFAPEYLTLAFDGGQPAGLVRVSVEENHGSRSGSVDILGVLPGHRRRGLGRALLRHSLFCLERLGCAQTHLTVDAGSSAAPPLYATEGFVSVKVREIWEREA